MASDKQNRTEKPTGRRIQKAREKGQVPRSREAASAAVFLGGLLVLMAFGETMLRLLETEMKQSLNLRLPAEMTISYVSTMFRDISFRCGIIVAPVMLAAVVLSVAANMMQGGLVFSAEPLGFKFEKLSPKNGIGRVFSKNGLMELGKNVVLLVMVSFICYQVVSEHLPLYPRMILMDVDRLLYWISLISYKIFIRVAVVLALVAVADFFFQKHRFLEQLKMTKQEVKEEFKDMEGDPIIKGRIRKVQREIARKRMMADVPTADVVITNPTHFAVALSYKVDSMDAPKVVAKGVGFLALKIKELAQQHNVPLVENRPLARALYKSVEIGESIPGDLYKAVAEILAYVYKAKAAFSR